jgi:hypothetical protein
VHKHAGACGLNRHSQSLVLNGTGKYFWRV